MTDNTEMLAAIEAHRLKTGKFGIWDNSKPEIGLDPRAVEQAQILTDHIGSQLDENDPWRKEPERLARIGLAAINLPGSPAVGALIRVYGDIGALEEIAYGNEQYVDGYRIAGIRAKFFDDKVLTLAAQAAADARADGQDYVIPGDDDYPNQLEDLGDIAPVGLFTKGDTSFLGDKETMVGFDGGRSQTQYGEFVTMEWVAATAGRDKTIVTGAGYGTPGSAARATLASEGRVVTALPSGLNVPIPLGHSALIERVQESGLTITECIPGSGSDTETLRAKNRLVAALAGTTVIVEAGQPSNSLETARAAKALGRRVFAVPGPINSKMSEGTAQLIREGTAQIIIDPIDLVE